jgi:zinc/manganese transport system substrate-binding protein
VGLALTAGLNGCLRRLEGDPWEGTRQLRVLTTIVPLHCLAAAIGEPEAEVRCFCITNGPHEFQPTAEEARLLNGADLVIANGLGLEGFLVPMVRGSGRRDLRVLRVAEELGQRGGSLIEVPGYEHHGHVHGPGSDPHVWLGIEEAQQLAQIICDTLCEMRPEHKQVFVERLEQVRKRLDSLKKLAEPLSHTTGALVTAHDAFRYLARSVFGPGYENRVLAVRGLHGEELSPADFTKLVQECRVKKARVLATEPGSQAVILDRLQESLGQKLTVIELDPIETAEPSPHKRFYLSPGWYFERMESNLRKLQEAFGKGG